MCNGAAKKVSADFAPCNIKGRHSFGNVETGLEMLFTWPQPVSDWLTLRSVTRLIMSETSFTKRCQAPFTRAILM